MNIRDAEMLQGSIQNLGNTFGRQRQLDVENDFRRQQMEETRKRTQLDDNFRQQQIEHYKNMEAENARRADEAARRADAQDKRTDLANQPKIQADLIDPDTNSAMTFTGTPEQLDGIVAGAAQKGKKITVGNRRAFAAQFSVGGAQFSFSDPDTAKKFADELKAAQGIDVYSAQQPNVSVTPGGQEFITTPKGHVIKGAPAPQPGSIKETRYQDKPELGSTTPTFRTNTVTTRPITGKAEPMSASFKTAEDVRDAYKAGKLDRDAAKKVLAEQFGLK